MQFELIVHSHMNAPLANGVGEQLRGAFKLRVETFKLAQFCSSQNPLNPPNLTTWLQGVETNEKRFSLTNFGFCRVRRERFSFQNVFRINELTKTLKRKRFFGPLKFQPKG